MQLSPDQAKTLLLACGIPANTLKYSALFKALNGLHENQNVVPPTDPETLKLYKECIEMKTKGKIIALAHAAPKNLTTTTAPGKKKGSKGKKSTQADGGPSNKEQVYKLWVKKGKKESDDPAPYFEAVSEAVKVSTIRGWLSAWHRGTNLPGCVTREAK